MATIAVRDAAVQADGKMAVVEIETKPIVIRADAIGQGPVDVPVGIGGLAELEGAAIAGVVYPLLFGRAEELADRPVRDAALER